MIRIWDLWIRLFHWSLVVAVFVLLVSGETGVGFYDWHRLAGEFVLALLLFRILWGVFGSSNAHLASLIVDPRKAVTHLFSLLRGNGREQHRGHNAAGGWAVLIMIVLLTVQAATGIFIADEDEFVEGAFYGALPSQVTDTLYNIHHTNASLIIIFVVIHIVMIAVYFFAARQNLLGPMFTGKLNWHQEGSAPEVKFSPAWLGLLLAALAFALVGAIVSWYG